MPFNLNLRKILIISGFVVVVVGLGFGIYFTFFSVPSEEVSELSEKEKTEITGKLPSSGLAKPKTEKPSEIIPTTETGGLPSAKTISTAHLTIGSADSATLSSDGENVQYYDSSSGLFYKIDSSGAVTPLSDKKFFSVENTVWSDDKNKAILEYPDGSNIVYNFATGEQTTIPKHWEDFEFSSDGKKILSKSMGDDINNRWLIISELDGTNAKVISALGDNASKVQIEMSPNEQIVGFSRTGDPTEELGTQEIFLLGQNQENFKSLKVNGLNFEAMWAEEGSRILYSVTDVNNDYKPTLWVTDVSGDNVGTNTYKVNLDTWVDKCSMVSGYRAYCAVPKTLEVGVGLGPSLADSSDDVFYLVDLKTGASTFIGEPDEDYSVDTISISENENTIYFTDKITGALHQISIK